MKWVKKKKMSKHNKNSCTQDSECKENKENSFCENGR